MIIIVWNLRKTRQYSQSNTGFTPAPEVNDRVALYFPNGNETKAFIIGALNNDGNGRFTDVANRNYHVGDSDFNMVLATNSLSTSAASSISQTASSISESADSISESAGSISNKAKNYSETVEGVKSVLAQNITQTSTQNTTITSNNDTTIISSGTSKVAGGMLSIGFLPFAIELDQSAREDFLAGFDQIDKGMLASPIGTDYKKDLEISKLARKLIFGNYNIEDKEKNIINETLDDVKDNFFELSEEERENEIIKNSTTAPKKFGIKLAKESIKSITTDKIVENRRPLYNWINQKTNTLQLFVPTKEWSDSTVEFLEDPYVTVIIESKKTID